MQGIKGTKNGRPAYTLRLHDEEVQLIQEMLGQGVLVTKVREYLLQQAILYKKQKES
jgi:hypothetical protein